MMVVNVALSHKDIHTYLAKPIFNSNLEVHVLTRVQFSERGKRCLIIIKLQPNPLIGL